MQINTIAVYPLELTFHSPGPVDGSVLTERPQRGVQQGHVHLTGCQHSHELRLPLGLVPGKQEVVLLERASHNTNTREEGSVFVQEDFKKGN